VIVIGPAAMPPAGAILMFPSAVPTLAVAAAEAVAVAVPVAFQGRAGAVAGDASAGAEAEAAAAAAAEAEAAPEAEAAADPGASEDRDEEDTSGAGADEDWLAEQPATARAANTAQTVATLTVMRRATATAGAHGYRADVGQRRSRNDDPLRSPYGLRPYGFLATPQ
jgi:hypothetical protein